MHERVIGKCSHCDWFIFNGERYSYSDEHEILCEYCTNVLAYIKGPTC